MPAPITSSSTGAPGREIGKRLPGDPATNPPLPENDPTVDYRLFHCMLRIRDPSRSLPFYIDLMGMRTIWTLDTGPFTVYYLGYPSSPAHRSDPTAWAQETAVHSVFVKTPGLLELCHHHGSEAVPEGRMTTGDQPPHLGFNHLGFSVPDVAAAVKRLRSAGVEVVKDVGEGPNEQLPVTRWEKEKGIATEGLDNGFATIMEQFAFVRDPDGYLIELVPQELKF